tara:strand:+ start:29 stop:709 length:681 start_codon:yes stop_codon:yes gene_type:complete
MSEHNDAAIKAELKHMMTKEDFYKWISEAEIRDIERLSSLEIKLANLDNEISEVKDHSQNEENHHRRIDSFFHREILPKCGSIVDREKSRILDIVERLKSDVIDLDANTIKKSNLTKYIGGAIGIIFAGGVGTVWNALYDMQQKLDTVPVLQTYVEELQTQRRETEKQLFTMEAGSTTLRARFDALEENQNKIRASNAELSQSVQTNSYSITDLLERISLSDDLDL